MKTKRKTLLATLAAAWAWIVKAWVMIAVVIVILVVGGIIVACLLSLCRKFLGDPGTKHNQSTNTTYWHGTTNFTTAPQSITLNLAPYVPVQYGVDTNIHPWASLACTNLPAIDWRSPGNYLVLRDTSNEYEYFFSDYSIVDYVHYTGTDDFLLGTNAFLFLEKSSNLYDWQPLTTNALIQAGGVLEYHDTNVWPKAFYRVRMQ